MIDKKEITPQSGTKVSTRFIHASYDLMLESQIQAARLKAIYEAAFENPDLVGRLEIDDGAARELTLDCMRRLGGKDHPMSVETEILKTLWHRSRRKE